MSTRFDFLLNYLDGLRPWLLDPAVTEIMVNPNEQGEHVVFVEKDGQMERVAATVEEHCLIALVTDIARNQLGREINAENPYLSATLDDGSRLAAVVPPNSSGGTTLAIRKFREQRFTLPELVNLGSIPASMAELLQAAIPEGKNVLISGANASGKTTMLNALAAACIPPDRRIVCIEDDVREIHLDNHPNKIHLQANAYYSMESMVKAALRLRIQNVIVGEVIGAEGMALLNALSTGHSGSFATIHGENAYSALDRLAACAMQAQQGLTYQSVRWRIAQSIHYVLHMRRRKAVSLQSMSQYDLATDQFDLLPLEVTEAVSV